MPKKYVKKTKLMTQSKTKLHTYDGTVITPLGKTQLTLTNPKNEKHYTAEFVVVEEDLMPLIGKKTSEDMNLITVHYENLESIMNVEQDQLASFADVFENSVGSLPGVVHLEVDDTVVPVISPACRVPFAMKSKVKAELKSHF
ncbi:uncharacterized protein [Littorina saxatilis]|uniref:uncharacterized protein n=1 Tax=Littorina saxatilis TaxID=31220 RepID=UPI0038B4E4FF